jgi:hypothetical protein
LKLGFISQFDLTLDSSLSFSIPFSPASSTLHTPCKHTPNTHTTAQPTPQEFKANSNIRPGYLSRVISIAATTRSPALELSYKLQGNYPANIIGRWRALAVRGVPSGQFDDLGSADIRFTRGAIVIGWMSSSSLILLPSFV